MLTDPVRALRPDRHDAERFLTAREDVADALATLARELEVAALARLKP